MKQTCSQRRWIVAQPDDAAIDAVTGLTGLSRTAAAVLASRGVVEADAVERFLRPDLERDWVDPDLIAGMPEVALRVADAVRAGQSIVVFGDFDLDGISAAAVAARGLKAMGARVSAMVPHRFTEGYGLSSAAIERAAKEHPDLLITVDCGISGALEVATLATMGIDVVVTDHHEPGDHVPVGVPVADPKLSEDSASRDLAGAGVALKLVQAVGRLCGYPDVWRDLTDIATLGTIADIVPLSVENRALVHDGVMRIRSGPRPCIEQLCAVAGVDTASFRSEAVSFSLAPRLNAAGRMADPTVALDLLLSDDRGTSEVLAAALDEHNKVRQSVEAELSAAATAQADEKYRAQRALVLAGEGWHEGVKGIVASRIVRAYGVPAFMFSIEDGVAKGSGRSVGTIDLFSVLRECDDILVRYGGHSAAVGVTLAAEDLALFEQRVLEVLDRLPEEEFETGVRVDAIVELEEVSVELGAELELLEPYGQGNPRPVFGALNVFMNGRDRVGKDGSHLKFTAYDGVASIPAIAFRCPHIDVIAEHDASVDMAFEISVDSWRGRTRAQMLVRDIATREHVDNGPSSDLVADLFEHADQILAREEYAGIEDAASFHTKLAGVTFEGRQDVLSRLSAGAPLRLERQPDNPFDANACAVRDAHGDQVGFLNKRLAAALAPVLDAGVAYDVEVADVTGGEGRSLGVNVVVTRRDVAQDDDTRLRIDLGRRERLAQLSERDLDRALAEHFIGDRDLHEAQRAALEALARGDDTLCVMATGRGKSLIFHLHAARTAIARGLASVFVYPLRALVADQAFHLTESFAALGLRVAVVTGESSLSERDDAFEDLRESRLDVVLTTPEFLTYHAQRFGAQCGRVGFLVVDEAHHVGLSRAGHRPAYARLGEAREVIGSPTVLAVTATASDDVARQIAETLGTKHLVLDPTVRENLRVVDARGAADKDGAVVALASRGGKTVVYVNSRDASVRIARILRKRVPELAWKTAFYNGGLSRSVRHAVERAFREGEVQVVVATSAFGEGVNIPDVRNVVLYHLPFNDVEFNQMAGRAGRDGQLSEIHLLFGDKDARINETILSSVAPTREDLATLYRVLRDMGAAGGEMFEITNAELAQRCAASRQGCRLDEKGVSAGIGVFKELGLVMSEGHGAYRRLGIAPSAAKVDLASSVRYAEGLDEIEEFKAFRQWVMGADSGELLERFNRPILPTVED